MSYSNVLFVDLLYSEGGSLDQDAKTIISSLELDYKVNYLRYEQKAGYRSIVDIFHHVFTHRYDKVIFLSSKVSHLFPLALLRVKTKCYAIYHFMPNHRLKFHRYSLKFLSKFFIIGVYAGGVANQIERHLGFIPRVLPSRIIDRKISLSMLREKLAQKKVSLLVPGIRPGVRTEVKLDPITKALELKYGHKLERICIQGEMPVDGENSKIVHRVGSLSQDEYDSLYREALIVVVRFHEDYEVRASGVILDALKNGCLILSENHSINRQYGFPKSIVTDLANLDSVIAIINGESDEKILPMLPGANSQEFKETWLSFLS